MRLAWAQPDAVGVLLPLYEAADGQEPEEDVTPEPTPTPVEPAQLDPALLPSGYERHTLVTFAPWNAYDFVWVPSPAWSPDGQVLVTGVHGPPLGNERPEDSPAFPLVALPGDGSYSASLAARAGMWAEPRFSPAGSELAYLQADEPLQSVNGRYRLTLMDRDGSNRRALFPPPEQPGLSAQPYTWSPDGQQIALVNPGPEGALLLVDTATGLAQQVTDGQTSSPRWAP